ncbi:uncharacterized protein LOC132901910 [Amyelois transitella]|uniref:uncharacterized protein LOC132901910 n=1 Tax=Amyelois transitella TaxID=680683 RepID=UPI00298F4239|nr:uncharacterized protein LOC132901910 [Amyelois transitella]
MRSDFEKIIDRLNLLMLEENPKFVPNYQELAVFDDLYCRIKRVRNNVNDEVKVKEPTVSKYSQRVQYLIGKLTHNALKITAGIVPTGETYRIIWDSLVKRYQDKRTLGAHYLSNIFDLENTSYTAQSLEIFIEKYSASILALKQLGISELSDFIFLNCALRNLDTQSVQAFELSVREKEIPSSEDLITFIRDQVKILQRSNNLSSKISNAHKTLSHSSNNSRKNNTYTLLSNSGNAVDSVSLEKCPCCHGNKHALYHCSSFRNLDSPKSRYDFIKSKNGCVNCCGLNHTVSNCNSSAVCGLCNKRHHTLLHFDRVHNSEQNAIKSKTHFQTSQVGKTDSSSRVECACTSQRPACQVVENVSNLSMNSAVGAQNPPYQPAPVTSSLFTDAASMSFNAKVHSSAILLATAQVYAKGRDASKMLIRCLIDNASMNNLITIDTCKLLNLPIIPLSNSFVKGIGMSTRPIHGHVVLNIESRVDSKQSYRISALVVDCLTDELPSCFIDKSDFTHLENICLADLTWNIPGDIHLILGAQLFPYIYLGDRVESGTSAPPAVLTTFGYVLMGDVPKTSSVPPFTGFTLNDVLQKFWELEEIPQMKYLSPEETECENLFTSSVSRDKCGRYSVSLPFCRTPSELGNSRAIALRRFMALERKFKHTPGLRENYNSVIHDYINNDYLSEVPQSSLNVEGYYIPHHAVIRADKPMPRIVLDPTVKTHTGLSLNDILYVGPNLQADLFLLLIDFRLFPIAMTADVKQMYLQIGIPEDDRKYLRILLRFNENKPTRAFQFSPLPFGLKSSLYLTMRTVKQLAEGTSHEFPEAVAASKSRLHIDDLVYSVPNDKIAVSLSKQLVSLFKAGSFDLVKSTSNFSEVLSHLPEYHRSTVNISKGGNFSEVLGLAWEPGDDKLFVTVCNVHDKCTKRNILSIVARSFDVQGVIAPVILYAELLLSNSLRWNDLSWFINPPNMDSLPDHKVNVLTYQNESLVLYEFSKRFSSWEKLLLLFKDFTIAGRQNLEASQSPGQPHCEDFFCTVDVAFC